MAKKEGEEVHSDQSTIRESPTRNVSTTTSTTAPTSGGKSWLKIVWDKVRISRRATKNAFKMSLPPVIALSMLQSDFVADYFTIYGYILAMNAFSVVPTVPRARFIRMVLATSLSICLSAALVLFALWCGIQARLHTTDPVSAQDKYNSSQAAILGIWLFFMIFCAGSYKSAHPLDGIPVLFFELYAIVGCTSGVVLSTVTEACEFSSTMLVNFLFGVGLSTGVGLFVFPLSCRQVFFESVADYLNAAKEVMLAQQGYLHSIEAQDPWLSQDQTSSKSQFATHREALDKLYSAVTKMRAEQEFAIRETAYGHLDGSQVLEVSDLLLRVMPAFSGLDFICDALNRIKNTAPPDTNEELVSEDWQTILQALHEPFVNLSDAMQKAIDHILLGLQLEARSKDADRSSLSPGSPDFIAWYDQQTTQFSKTRELVAQSWLEKSDTEVPSDDLQARHVFQKGFHIDEDMTSAQRRPLTVIYIQFLLFSMSRELFDLAVYVDARIADGSLTKKRFVGPSNKHFQQWTRYFRSRQKLLSGSQRPNSDPAFDIHIQDTMHPKKKVERDPEHLPPETSYQLAGNYIRIFPRFMRSDHATHGLRVACAVMSVAIGFYIETSYSWFSKNRWLWAMFAIVLTMNRTAGMSLFMYICRIGGTAAAMCVALAIYYMVVGHTVGVLILIWVWFFIAGYLTYRFPFYTPAIMVAGLASIVMVGNELQDKKLGFARIDALGQAAHEEYLMAPERLAIVAAGVGIAFFWTIFPYPLSEHTELRQDLASTFYYLASYHSMIAKEVSTRARGGSLQMATRNDNDLAKARAKCFARLQFLFGRLKDHIKFTKFQVVLGGKFPTERYSELIKLCERICTASATIGYASTSFVKTWEDNHGQVGADGQPKAESHSLKEFRKLVEDSDIVSEEVTSSLIMLSNHLASGRPFPPLTKKPDTRNVAETVHDTKNTMLNISYLTEPGYAGFVTMLTAGRGINKAVTRQIELCQELVGVLDFSSFIDSEKQAIPQAPETLL